MLRQGAQLHDRGGVKGVDGIEPLDGRSRRPGAGVDEDCIGRERPHATVLERHFDDPGRGEAAIPEDELDILGLLQPTLSSRSEVVHNGLLALADLGHVHGHRTTAHAEVGGAPGQVGDAGAGDHGLGGRAPHVDASAADVLPFDDRGPAASAPQVQSEWFSRLAGAQDDRVKTLRLHGIASTTKKGCAVVIASSRSAQPAPYSAEFSA
jgi:hypothetical protein